MTDDRILDEPTLAKMWRVHRNTPGREWRLAGLLTSDEQRGPAQSRQHFYYLSTIEEHHRRVARGFTPDLPPMPTVAELLAESGRSLLLTSEVAERLGVTRSAIQHRTDDNALPVLQLARASLRYPALHIGILASRQKETVPLTTVTEMLGLTRLTVRALPLQKVKVIGTTLSHFTRESMLAVLADLLPDHVTPEQWWQGYEQYREPLTPLRRSATRCHMAAELLAGQLDNERLPYIRTPGGYWLIPERVLRQIQAERLALPARDVARAFGTTEAVAAGWIESYALCHARHGGKKAPLCPSRQCLREYAETHSATSAEVDGADWLTQALEGAVPILAPALLDEMRVISKAELQDWIAQTNAPAVRLPDGEISLSRTAYFAFRRYARRELGVVDG